MEKNLYKCLDEISQSPGVKGCLLADEQGLCLAAKGKMPSENSGIIAALAQQARLLEPGSPKSPTIVLQNENKQLYIHQGGKLTVAVHKLNPI